MKKIRKKSVEEKLRKLINKYELNSSLSVAKIKDWIFNERGDSAIDASNRFQKKFLNCFVNLPTNADFEKIFQLSVDAWNVFPHKSLGGISPQEMFEKDLKKNSQIGKNRNKMPDIIVGGKKMSGKKYEFMLKEMEKAQKSLRGFIEKEIIPDYKKFIGEITDLSKEDKEKYILVAETFFDRILWVGFIDYEAIRPEFVKYEFPKWWQTHVIFSSLDENQVWSALRILINFIKNRYGLEIGGLFENNSEKN